MCLFYIIIYELFGSIDINIYNQLLFICVY